MPWKKDFTLSDEMSPSGIVWPAGKAAVSVVVDYSVPAGAEGIDEAAIAYARTVWGNAVSGDWLIDYLNAYGVKATFAVPLAMARAFPESVRRAHADGHEIAAGSFAKEDVAGLSPDEERERTERTFSGLAELTGTRPEGWFTLRWIRSSSCFSPEWARGAGSCRRGRFGKTGPPSWKGCGRGEGSPHL